MPLEFENSQAGATDISGMPPPEHARTPQSVAGDAGRKVHAKQRGPQTDKNPLQSAADDIGQAGKAAGEGLDKAGDWLSGQGFAKPKQSLNPIDWAKEYEQDASVPWGWARQVYKTLSGTYHDGVHGLYAGDDGQSKVLRAGTDFLAGSIPTIGLQMSAQDLLSSAREVAGQESEQQRQQEVQQHSEEGVQDAPGRAVDIASMAMGGTAGTIAQLGLPIAESFLGGDVDEQHTALAWSGVAGMLMGFSHLPPPVRKVLLDRFGDWPGVEKMLAGAVDAKAATNRAFQDPIKRGEQIRDWITTQLDHGSMAARLTPLKAGVGKAAKEGEAKIVKAEVGPEGQVKLLASDTGKSVRKLLNRVGVEDVDALVHKAQAEGITDPEAIKAIKEHWKALGQTYDLQRFSPEEMPLRDPRRHQDELADQQAGLRHTAALNHMLDQIHRGLFANHSNPMTAIMRALAGHSRAASLTYQQWMHSVVRLLGDDGLTEQAQAKLMQAAEGDEAVYHELRPEQKAVVDAWGLLRSATREISQDTDYAKNFVPNWVPRTDKDVGDMVRGRGRPSRASVISTEARRHREESLQWAQVPDESGLATKGQLVLAQRFTGVADTNKALAAARTALISTLTGDAPLSAELLNDPKARGIHELARVDPAAAMEEAKKLAAQKYTDKETNFLKTVNRVFQNQVRSVHTHMALEEFTRMLAKDGRAAAIKLRPGATRQRDEFQRQGYKFIDHPGFQSFVFHPDLAANLNRYVNHVSGGLRDVQGFKQALKLEGAAIAGIMFSPLVHGLNVGGRLGVGFLMHPLQMLSYLKDGKAIRPHQWDDQSWMLRSEAYNAGVVPHYRGKSYADNALGKMQDALGDVEEQLPNASHSDSRQKRLASMWDNVARPHRWVNNYFWGAVNDFGVMMYHLEKTSAQRHGLAETAATEWAARRANSWMGMVAPEDTNPMVHDLSRLFLFAPNWWRTWGELMLPLYKRAGFTSDPAYMKFAAYQSAKTISAALAWQKTTGHLLNTFLSGHPQHQNQPGNQDKLEVSNPAVLNTLKTLGLFSDNPADPHYVDANGINPKTGARATVENPLARQQLASELAMGLQSGHADHQLADTEDGLAKFLVSRASPLLSGVSAAANVDLYQSVNDHQLRGVTQDPGFQPSPASLFYGALMMTPIGSGFAQQVQRNAQQGEASPVESILGTRIPTSLQQAVGDIGDPVGRTIFSALTGANAPYATAQKSRGIKPSDQDYERAKQLTDEYHKRMTVLGAEVASGQMTPARWRTTYRDISLKHSAELEALFKNSPEYVNGAQGMASQWEALYDKATKDDGTLNQDQLSSLQAQFRQQHSADQMHQMDAILKQNDSRFPMLALYHKTQQQFDDWQQNWAVQNNVDINQLRRELGEYGALYGDTRGSTRYLSQHRDVRAYEHAKKREFDRSQPGLMHALFYGQNATVMRYLRAHHLTASEFATEQGVA
jgi:hypothetical protein